MRHIFIIICGLFCYSVLSAQNPLVTSDSLAQQAWVNSQYAQMSLDEKLGQLFMVSVASNQSKQTTDKIKNLIVQEHLGGVIFPRVDRYVKQNLPIIIKLYLKSLYWSGWMPSGDFP